MAVMVPATIAVVGDRPGVAGEEGTAVAVPDPVVV